MIRELDQVKARNERVERLDTRLGLGGCALARWDQLVAQTDELRLGLDAPVQSQHHHPEQNSAREPDPVLWVALHGLRVAPVRQANKCHWPGKSILCS